MVQIGIAGSLSESANIIRIIQKIHETNISGLYSESGKECISGIECKNIIFTHSFLQLLELSDSIIIGGGQNYFSQAVLWLSCEIFR